MPDSMFGLPSQHLLPSHPPAGTAAPDPRPAPVQPPPPSFKDFRFNSIGKQPELLSRISLPQPDRTDYHSPTPSPTSTPAFSNDATFQPNSSSRPTLFQQLAGNDLNRSTDGSLSRHSSTSQSNRSLVSRIQMDGSPPSDVVNATHFTASSFPSPPSHVGTVKHTSKDASLIPPVEILSQPSDSSPPTPASWAPSLELLVVQSPLMNAMTIGISQTPLPTVATITAPRPAESSPSTAAEDVMMQDLQPSPTVTATDSLVARQERLQAISANLASLASPLLLLSSQSSSPAPSSVSRANDNTTPHQFSQLQLDPDTVLLHPPYLVDQSYGRVGPNFNDDSANSNDSSLALVHPATTVMQEHETQRNAVIEAVRNLNSALQAIHRAQIDSENALASQIKTFEEQREAFEQTKRAEEATLHKEHQELQRIREEFHAKEASLVSLEQESKAREVARKAVLAKRQAQKEEKRAADAKRMQEVQEQIAAAMIELKEVGALKTKNRLGQLATETMPDDLPTKPQEGMDEEEVAIIKSRNDLLCAIKHLRRMHSDKVQKLEEYNGILRRIEEERKQREAEEAERRRIAEQDRLRAHTEAERARQVLDAKQRQLEAEKKRQEIESNCEQARLLAEQQAHAETQVHKLGRTEVTSDQTLGYRSLPEEGGTSQKQDTAETRATLEANALSSGATAPMSVDEAFLSHHPDPSSDVHGSSGGSHSATLQVKQENGSRIPSGNALVASTSRASAGHLPPKPLARPSISTPDRVAEVGKPPATCVPGEGGHGSFFPARFASEFNRIVNADIPSTPDRKPVFPRTPKSQTVLDTTIGGSEEFTIGPVTRVSPAQQNINLRHLKRYRNRIEENDSGDRSVRTSVKSEDISSVSLQREERDESSRERVQTSLLTNPPASLPPRPAIISPPRPRKRHAASASQINSSSSCPPGSNKSSSTNGKAKVADEPSREVFFRGSPSSQAMSASIHPLVPADAANSLLLGSVHTEPQHTPIESRVNTGRRRTHDRAENYDTSESASAAQPHELNGDDRSRSNRRFTDEHRRARNGNSARHPSDRYSPSFATSRSTVTSPTQPHCPIDSWRPQNSSNAPRIESMRATSPTLGRKRPSEFDDHDHGHRARRQRSGDVWIAQEHDYGRVDSYRLHRDRHLDSEFEERRATHHIPASPPDRIRSYPLDVPRPNYDNGTFILPFTEEPRASNDWEQPYRRPENDDTHPRHHPSAPGYSAVADRHRTDDVRIGQTYEPTTEMDIQPDPSLLARMSNSQRFPPSTNFRGRGRGEPNRGRGDSRGRGRGIARGGPALIERLTSGPSLGDRLT